MTDIDVVVAEVGMILDKSDLPGPKPDELFHWTLRRTWLELRRRLRWTPCSEAMPTEPGEYECIERLSAEERNAVVYDWDATDGFHLDWSDGSVVHYRDCVTHWRPWSGWPGEEGSK